MENMIIEPTTRRNAMGYNMTTSDMELSEEYLTRRFARPQREPSPITYEITRDAGYLHQYFLLRENMFINAWGLQNFCGQKDEHDDRSEIMVARIDNHVVGGCRLTFSEKDALLPMEKPDFSLASLMPDLKLDQASYVEVSRMAILPEYQNSTVMLELSRQLLKRAASNKARYAFTLSPIPLARNYRKAASLFGLKWEILLDTKVPEREEYEGIRMVLSQLDLAPAYRPKNIGQHTVLLAEA
ncbi:MAG: GNAT family N-acyltransferase [Rickettsiales bacterium]|nr:GNAT family N-acyltransferase [Rickettsiales bacterium]